MKMALKYCGELKIGAVYQSRGDSRVSRRITRIKNGSIRYVLFGQPHRKPVTSDLTEDMFRDFTLREIPAVERLIEEIGVTLATAKND